MLNISPVGRDCSFPERAAFEVYDKEHLVRQKFVQAIKDKFPDVPIEMAIGGQISFDLFPKVIILFLLKKTPLGLEQDLLFALFGKLPGYLFLWRQVLPGGQ